MRILFITPSPPNNLNRIRSKNIIRALSDLGHEVTVISLYKNEKEHGWLKDNSRYACKIIGIHHPIWLSLLQCLIGVFLPIPLRVSYCYSLKLKKELKKHTDEFDIIYIKRLRMAQYAKYFNKDKVFIDITDSMIKYYSRLKKVTRGFKKIIAIEEYYKMKIYEPYICNKYTNIVICSSEDKNYLVKRHNCKNSHFRILENGLYLKDWSGRTEFKQYNIFNLIFLGVMNVETNILSCEYFIKNVIHLLDKRFKLKVVGPNPDPNLLKYSSKRIRFTGYVNDLCDELSSGGIFVCPIISGAGVKNKILQASILGFPIISTSMGIEGIKDTIVKNILIADTPIDFKNRIVQVSKIKILQLNKIIDEQRRLVINNYDVTALVKKFMQYAKK